MRGNPLALCRRRTARRSIPAYAGEPLRWAELAGWLRVYPRVCGGTVAVRRERHRRQGLSPRMRGNPCSGVASWLCVGSIPAYAGEPSLSCCPAASATVYPRVCGGTVGGLVHNDSDEGLSPRMRGNPSGQSGGYPKTRSIPAYAGEPSAMTAPATPGGVYPRVCGGTAPATPGGCAGQGLSPRMRGNPVCGAVLVAFWRSIPAYAGEPN